MARFCELCQLSYPDDLVSCPMFKPNCPLCPGSHALTTGSSTTAAVVRGSDPALSGLESDEPTAQRIPTAEELAADRQARFTIPESAPDEDWASCVGSLNTDAVTGNDDASDESVFSKGGLVSYPAAVAANTDEEVPDQSQVQPGDAPLAEERTDSTTTFLPVVESPGLENEEELDLAALSHEPEDSLAAEFAELGKESRSPSMPRQSYPSNPDLFAERVLAEGDSSLDLSGPAENLEERPSGIDLIAEAVESGVDLTAHASDRAEVADSQVLTIGTGKDEQLAEDSAVELGVVPRGPKTPGQQLAEDALELQGVPPSVKSANLEEAVDLNRPLAERRTSAPTRSTPQLAQLQAKAQTRSASLATRSVEEDDSASLWETSVTASLSATGRSNYPVWPWLGGGLSGSVLGGGLTAAALLLLGPAAPAPSSKPTEANLPPAVQAPADPEPLPPEPVLAIPTTAQALTARLAQGHFDQLLSLAEKPELSLTPQGLALRGHLRWLGYLREQTGRGLGISGTDGAVQQVIADLKKADTLESRLWLGQVQEVLGNVAEAKRLYQEGFQRAANDRLLQRIFRAALDRLESRPTADTGRPTGRRSDAGMPGPAYLLVLLLASLQTVEANDSGGEEAGFKFWEAATAAGKADYSRALQALAEADKLHQARRFTHPGRGLNPLSDPTEEIFLRCCQLLREYWQLRQDLQGHDSVPALVSAKVQAERQLQQLQENRGRISKALSEAGLADVEPVEAITRLVQSTNRMKAVLEEFHRAFKAAGLDEREPVKTLARLTADAKQEAMRLRELEGLLDRVAARLQVERAAVLKALDELLEQAQKTEATGLVQQPRSELNKARVEPTTVRRAEQPTPPSTFSPAVADTSFAAGLVQFFAGKPAAAESALTEAIAHFDHDARYYYFRGLARLKQGRHSEAELDFRRGADLERLNRPGRREVNASLERIQGTDREILSRYRPTTGINGPSEN